MTFSGIVQFASDLVEGVADFVTANNWPLVALIGLYWLRKPITEMLGRIRKASREGVEFSERMQETGDSTIQTDLKSQWSKEWPEGLKYLLEPIMEKAEMDLKEEVKTRNESERDLLMKGYVQTQAQRIVERIYSLIYGSQINALQALSNRSGTANLKVLREKYEQARTENPDFYRELEFETWLSFLTGTDLVTLDDEKAKISDFGQYILDYANELRKSGAIRGL